ncbi:diguanylate cyclase [Zoogloea sp.]|uniref:diguanylate cyclase domain-containing protein n=1 Tax=Zoogloea sp. TaxID=49181 RepID=UPI00261051BF|nr:diguanylate cyclase [Zoogloea sp.]MDD3352242.1 diguanylate cyclase [Zoogloea sp.]
MSAWTESLAVDRWRSIRSLWRGSLRLRVATGVLTGVLLALWLTTLGLGYHLRQEVQTALSAQQFSVVSLLAGEIDRSVNERMKALEMVAGDLTEEILADPVQLRRQIRAQKVLQILFNWGVLVTDQKGTTLVGIPEHHGWDGINYLDVPVIRQVLETGVAVIGQAQLGRTSGQPLVPMVVPLRDRGGETVGTLIGLVNLAQPNFLDEIGANTFGRRGGYLITDPVQRIFIAGTNKSRVMQPGPPKGVNPVYDRYIEGYDGSGLALSSQGVVELSSSKRVSSTGWLMQSVLPAEEAFAPLDALQLRLLAAAVGLTLMAGGLAWWWLRRELTPLGEAARLLAGMKDGTLPRRHLPVRRDDEIGALAGAFNGLLDAIVESEARAAEHSFNQRLRTIVAQVPGVVFQFRVAPDGVQMLSYVSDAVRELSGLAPEDLMGDSSLLLRLVHPDDVPLYLESQRTAAAGLGPWRVECRIHHPQRGLRWVRIDALPEADPDGSVSWHGFAMDITESKETESELRIAAATFETQQGIFITDARERILRVNQAFTVMTGYTPGEAIGQTPALLRSGHHSAEFYDELRTGLVRDGFWQGELWNRRKDGVVFVEWATISEVRDPSGRLTHYVAAFSDITEHKKAEEQIHRLAFFDPLTQLPNRRLFHDRLDQAMGLSARSQHLGAVLFLDLDSFKGLNDSHGHVMGDELLVEVARRLTACMRETDTVARLGGDEFVVILEGLDANEAQAGAQARQVAEKLRQVLAEPYCLSLPTGGAVVTHRCSASIGVCLFRGRDEARGELIKQADIAMYRAKSAGRNAIRFFHAGAPQEEAGQPLLPH